MSPNPCTSCGACCAYFRASFHWSETDPFLGGRVPAALTHPIGGLRVAMNGTSSSTAPRCDALEGTVGQDVRCTIYEVRASVCREFSTSWADGQPNERCDRARAAWGLGPLPAPGEPGPSDLPDRPLPRAA